MGVLPGDARLLWAVSSGPTPHPWVPVPLGLVSGPFAAPSWPAPRVRPRGRPGPGRLSPLARLRVAPVQGERPGSAAGSSRFLALPRRLPLPLSAPLGFSWSFHGWKVGVHPLPAPRLAPRPVLRAPDPACRVALCGGSGSRHGCPARARSPLRLDGMGTPVTLRVARRFPRGVHGVLLLASVSVPKAPRA